MGYDLHITRAPEWTESLKHPIAESDWLAVVHADASLRVDTSSELRMRDRMSGEVRVIHPVVWTTPGGKDTPLWFDEGEVTTKNPSPEAIAKMKELAARLQARVVGDDGEEY
jgi:hypothetical protein